MNGSVRLFVARWALGSDFSSFVSFIPKKAYKSVNVHCLDLRKAIEGFLFHLSFNYEPHLNDLVAGVCGT